MAKGAGAPQPTGAGGAGGSAHAASTHRAGTFRMHPSPGQLGSTLRLGATSDHNSPERACGRGCLVLTRHTDIYPSPVRQDCC
jgi:hypothetical protein